jgi:hypothetical protein
VDLDDWWGTQMVTQMYHDLGNTPGDTFMSHSGVEGRMAQQLRTQIQKLSSNSASSRQQVCDSHKSLNTLELPVFICKMMIKHSCTIEPPAK